MIFTVTVNKIMQRVSADRPQDALDVVLRGMFPNTLLSVNETVLPSEANAVVQEESGVACFYRVEEETTRADSGIRKFVIPVSWEVYSTVTVEARSIEEAYAMMSNWIDELPTDVKSEYIEGTYKYYENDGYMQPMSRVMIDRFGRLRR